MDATKQLQFWVTNGTLSASSVPKSSWLGFYDLQTEAKIVTNRPFKRWDWRIWKHWKKSSVNHTEPRLTIRYSNSGNVYELTVGETDLFVLPCNDTADCLGNADFVH
jgi:hypothetical protein